MTIYKSVRNKSGVEGRTKGNPNDGTINREGARAGQQRTPDDIPLQGTSSSPVSVATYRLGPALRPPIAFDNGFLDKFKPREPTISDRLEYEKWEAIVRGADDLRPDLSDAVAAYKHFLHGAGADYNFSYERYVRNDRSGRITLRNAILSIQFGVLELWKAFGQRKFSLTGSAIACGTSTMFPYPATENWQKAIGFHSIWLSGDATVSGGGTPNAAEDKAGTHRFHSKSVTVAADGAILVKPGDTISGYSAALYNGDFTRVNEFGRKTGGTVLPLWDVNQIEKNEILYHIPTYADYSAVNGTGVQPSFALEMVLHAEDRYNFNPGAKDIGSGIPDDANGIFEITGLAHQFDQFGTLRRSLRWMGFGAGITSAAGGTSWEPQPQ